MSNCNCEGCSKDCKGCGCNKGGANFTGAYAMADGTRDGQSKKCAELWLEYKRAMAIFTRPHDMRMDGKMFNHLMGIQHEMLKNGCIRQLFPIPASGGGGKDHNAFVGDPINNLDVSQGGAVSQQKTESYYSYNDDIFTSPSVNYDAFKTGVIDNFAMGDNMGMTQPAVDITTVVVPTSNHTQTTDATTLPATPAPAKTAVTTPYRRPSFGEWLIAWVKGGMKG